MPTFSSDGVEIYYQVAGEGYPLVLAHEFAGDITSWEPQVNYFSRRYQVITIATEAIHLLRCQKILPLIPKTYKLKTWPDCYAIWGLNKHILADFRWGVL